MAPIHPKAPLSMTCSQIIPCCMMIMKKQLRNVMTNVATGKPIFKLTKWAISVQKLMFCTFFCEHFFHIVESSKQVCNNYPLIMMLIIWSNHHRNAFFFKQYHYSDKRITICFLACTSNFILVPTCIFFCKIHLHHCSIWMILDT